ncbi:hypothetical protein D9615_008970 [Tricholomella constricta]|uniref:Fungal-type protein kinase domain-containing protein n=1 Tax=Tricholomella constricta TaxID=117010 RepID=A0A8H5H103_9AGAR|nr:hypothetical protein D9615_008970 [Tricholomella constricta]
MQRIYSYYRDLNMVKSTIECSWNVSPTGPLLDSLFPVRHSDVDEVYDKLVEEQVYDEIHERWSWLPTEDSDSEVIERYDDDAPLKFVQVAEAVRKAYPSKRYDRIPYRSVWTSTRIDRGGVEPEAKDGKACLGRPEVLNVLGMEDDAAEWDGLLDGLEGNSESEKLQAALVAWWLRVNVVVQIKPVETDDLYKHVDQLVGYLREALREQLDRRFVPGLLLSGSQLAVWVADHSGVLGSQTTFDIHKEPKRFIQVILGCSILPPERLGWDTTMRLCSNPSARELKYVHLFHKDVAFETYSRDTYTRHWVIEMPSNEDQNKRELFMTSRVLSRSKEGCMQGRASVVWAAWKVEDLKMPGPHKIYVLKQCWRPTKDNREAEMYPGRKEALENHIGRVYSSEDVQVDGVEINTKSFVRCDLEHLPPPERPTPDHNVKQKVRQLPRARLLWELSISDNEKYISKSPLAKEPNWRVQTRILLEDYGWPLHQFRDLSELVLVVLHAAQASQYLHMQAKTLQRDISIGNILICLDDSGHSRGCLIDLDHAMKTTDVKPTVLARAWAAPPLAYDIIQSRFEEKTNQTCTEDAAHALDYLNVAWYAYYMAILKLRPQLVEKNPITPGDLGFLEEVSEIPDYSKQKVSFGATLPFASAEVLTDMRTFYSGYFDEFTSPIVFHDIIHDLEALFWCVTYLCVSHEGPGGKPRTELQPDYIKEHPKANQDLRRISYYFFSSQNQAELAQKKSVVFQLNEYESHVVPQFHPYFEPMKGLMTQWWRILSMAYQWPIFEAAHGWLITALETAVEELKDQAPGITPEETKEVGRSRKKDLSDLAFVPGADANNDESRQSVSFVQKPSAVFHRAPAVNPANAETTDHGGPEQSISIKCDINDVYDKLVKQRVYDEISKQWSGLPTEETAGVKYDAPFVQVAEAIRKAYPSTKCDGVPYRSTWIYRHSLKPKSTDEDTILVRPDILNILGMDDDAVEWDSRMDGLNGESQLQAVAAWWLRVNVIVEIKPFEGEDLLRHVNQLVDYLREALREQLDRRFIPGLLLSGASLLFNVSLTLIQEPKRFIQVILGCSILPPERLGWDTTMRLCSSPSAPEPKYVHSFHKDVAFETYSSDNYTRHWVIEMPSNENQNKRELFMTSRMLSLSKEGCMQGRASVVWAAWKVEDLKTPGPHKIYVLQCWRPTKDAREAEMYPGRKEAFENHIGRVYSSEDVQVDGVEINTKSFIRCNLERLPPFKSSKVNRNGKREANQLQEAGSLEPYLFITTKSDKVTFESVKAVKPNWRVQTRILLEDYGWPLHHFRDLSELVLVILHAVRALQFLHMQAKTLQCDMSIGNILICLDDTGHSRGCLIDLDHAIKTTDAKPTILTLARAAPNSAAYEATKLYFNSITNKVCSDDAAVALKFLKDWSFYHEAILTLNSQLTEKDLITPGDLGFLEQIHEIPDYSTSTSQSLARGATLPFASPEVLTRMRIFSQRQEMIKSQGVIRDIIHDLEALFWCVTYICVTHQQPGGKRRTELLPDFMEEHPDANQDLRRINYYLFTSKNENELAHNKNMLFQFNEYASHVVPQFHPYFEPLKDLMKHW